MAQTRLQIYFRNTDGKAFRRVWSYINPVVDNSYLKQFVDKSFSLTNNHIVEVFKIASHSIDNEPVYSDDIFITSADIKRIFDSSYTPAYDDEPITESAIASILSGRYTPAPDDDALVASDFIF